MLPLPRYKYNRGVSDQQRLPLFDGGYAQGWIPVKSCRRKSCTNSKREGRVLRADDGLRLVGEPAGYAEISEAVQAVPGVIAHGLFVNVCDERRGRHTRRARA